MKNGRLLVWGAYALLAHFFRLNSRHRLMGKNSYRLVRRFETKTLTRIPFADRPTLVKASFF